MAKPAVLLLDEPSSGLDPLMQREFLALIEEARDEGCTVFLSSHILTEVEAIADRIGILREGHLIAIDTVEALRARAVRRLDLSFEKSPPLNLFEQCSGVREASATDTTIHLVIEGSTADLFTALAPYRIEDVISHEPDLETIFLSLYNGES